MDRLYFKLQNFILSGDSGALLKRIIISSITTSVFCILSGLFNYRLLGLNPRFLLAFGIVAAIFVPIMNLAHIFQFGCHFWQEKEEEEDESWPFG